MGLLDEFRDIPERGAWRTAVPAAGPSLAAVVAAGGRATTRLSGRSRGFFWTMLPVSAVLAPLSPLLAGALAAGSNGGDVFAVAAGLLRAPHPAVQPSVLAIAAVLLLVLAIVTRGFTRVTTASSRLAMTAAVAAVIAGAPFALVIVGFVVVIAVGAALLLGLVVLIFSALASS